MRHTLSLSNLALLLAGISLGLAVLDGAAGGSLPSALLLVATALGQQAWQRRRAHLARALLYGVAAVLTLMLISYMTPEHAMPQATWDRLADGLVSGTQMVDWRAPLLATLTLACLATALLLRTRANLGAPLLLGVAALLLAAQALEVQHADSLLALPAAPLEQATLWALLAGQLAGVAGGWRVTLPSLNRALWPSLALALLALLFWHQQKSLTQASVQADLAQQGQRLADRMSREIDAHLSAMRRFAASWSLLDAPPDADQWERQAALYHRDYRYFLNIAYIDPDSRIRHVHPSNEINRRLLGTRLYEDQPQGRPALEAALGRGEEGRTDIIELLQGVPGVIHYLPVTRIEAQRPRGAVAMVVGLPGLADALFEAGEDPSLALALQHRDAVLARRDTASRLGPWQQQAELRLDGLPLTLVSRPSLASLLARLPRQPVVSLVVGLLFAYLLYMALFAHHQMAAQHRSVRRSNRDLRREVRNRTRLQREVEWLADHDELTRLPNRRAFLQALDASAEHRPISLLLCDIDHFKRINDRLGHLAGDRYLVRVAELGRSVVERAGGVFARFGGEEFVACLPGHDAEAAERVAEALRHEVIALGLTHESGDPLTLSIGVATRGQGPLDIDALLQAADEALYAAKSGGRDRVMHAAPRSAADTSA